MSNKILKAVIFDFDGVILDTESALFESWQQVFAERGFPFPLERWAANVGGYQYDVFDPLSHLEELLCESVDREEINDARRARYLERVNRQDSMPGVREALEVTRSRKLRMAVASSSSSGWVNGHLERLGLARFFDAVCCGDAVTAVKPAPDVYHLALQRLDLHASEVFVIEDSPKGIAAARAASLYCVVAPNPVTRAAPLHGCHRRLEVLASVPFCQVIDETEEALSSAF